MGLDPIFVNGFSKAIKMRQYVHYYCVAFGAIYNDFQAYAKAKIEKCSTQ